MFIKFNNKLSLTALHSTAETTLIRSGCINRKWRSWDRENYISRRVTKMGSTIGQKIDYNGVGALSWEASGTYPANINPSTPWALFVWFFSALFFCGFWPLCYLCGLLSYVPLLLRSLIRDKSKIHFVYSHTLALVTSFVLTIHRLIIENLGLQFTLSSLLTVFFLAGDCVFCWDVCFIVTAFLRDLYCSSLRSLFVNYRFARLWWYFTSAPRRACSASDRAYLVLKSPPSSSSGVDTFKATLARDVLTPSFADRSSSILSPPCLTREGVGGILHGAWKIFRLQSLSEIKLIKTCRLPSWFKKHASWFSKRVSWYMTWNTRELKLNSSMLTHSKSKLMLILSILIVNWWIWIIKLHLWYFVTFGVA